MEVLLLLLLPLLLGGTQLARAHHGLLGRLCWAAAVSRAGCWVP